MSAIMTLHVRDRALLLFFLGALLFAVLAASFSWPPIYLIVAFNALFLFNLFLYFMLYLNKKDFGLARTPKKYLPLAVVVPVYNSMNTITKCIESIKAMSYPIKFRIIVVDDCSTDGTREVLEKMSGIELIKHEKNSGKAVALSTGIKKAKESFIALIDSDSYPEKEALQKMMGYLDDKSTAAVTCLVLPDKKKSLLQKIQFVEYLSGFGLNNTLLSSIGSSYVVPGPLTIFKREVFDVVGNFEAGNLAEDMEFGLRMKKHGMKIANCYEALVLTDIPSTIKNLFIQRDRWYRGAASNFIRHKSLLFNKKNPDFGFFMMPFLFFTQVLIIAVLIRLVIFFIKDSFLSLNIAAVYLSLGGSVSMSFAQSSLPASMLFFIITYICLAWYFWLCFRTVKYKLKLGDVVPLLILIFIYPYFISVVYAQGYFKEIIGVKAKWRRVST